MICLGEIFEKSARLIGKMWAKPMLFISSNIIGQNMLILPPRGWVSAPMNRHRPPAMVKTLPMIILLISSGSRRLAFPTISRKRQPRRASRS